MAEQYELALRKQFIEAYAGRKIDQSMRSIAQRLEITEGELRLWMRDPAFRDQLRSEDVYRLEMAREVALRHITAVVENQAKIAEGSTNAANRAAVFVARVAGLEIERANKDSDSVKPAALARDIATIMREQEEVDRLLRDHVVQVREK